MSANLQGISDSQKSPEVISPNMTGGELVGFFCKDCMLALGWQQKEKSAPYSICMMMFPVHCSHVRLQRIIHALCMGNQSS